MTVSKNSQEDIKITIYDEVDTHDRVYIKKKVKDDKNKSKIPNSVDEVEDLKYIEENE